ncbi:nicotinamide riboside kinase 1-like [Chanodichthys erythropterus]|uniref:nicotinamide riboside kinase 1-like n=1 Tax=Chanodichthys erythropterus TaxID=933992 RepID=UPI00351F6D9B
MVLQNGSVAFGSDMPIKHIKECHDIAAQTITVSTSASLCARNSLFGASPHRNSHRCGKDPEHFMTSRGFAVKSTASEPPNVFVLIVEGFLIFNHRHLNSLFNKKYFLQIPYETCKERRSSRVYVPPDPPGYLDGYVWPMYLKNRKAMEEAVNDIEFLDGTQKRETLLSAVLADIQ